MTHCSDSGQIGAAISRVGPSGVCQNPTFAVIERMYDRFPIIAKRAINNFRQLKVNGAGYLTSFRRRSLARRASFSQEFIDVVKMHTMLHNVLQGLVPY